ncbi:MAG: carboxymethylenebutenolidase [Acidimicrobiaceae bacterium]
MRTNLPTGTTVEIASSDHPTRGVVVVPDIMGLRPLFDDMVARLASEYGWAVAAVEPFAGRESMSIEERMAAMAGLDDERQVSDLAAAAHLLDMEPVGILGFCMGGMYAMKAAASGRFDRAASFYGMIRVSEAWRGATQRDAIDVLAEAPGSAERILAIIGTADPYTPERDVDDLEAAGATVVRYEGAEHGFVHDASRPAHRADDAADAWRRVTDWFRR